MLNLEIVAAFMNARADLLCREFGLGNLDVTPNEALVGGVIDSLPAKVIDRAYTLACKQPLYAAGS